MSNYDRGAMLCGKLLHTVENSVQNLKTEQNPNTTRTVDPQHPAYTGHVENPVELWKTTLKRYILYIDTIIHLVYYGGKV